jgi:hypothetical protein
MAHGVATWVRLVSWQNLIAEDEIAEDDVLRLGASLEQAAEAVRIFNGLDRFVPLRLGDVGFRVMMRMADSSH